MDGPPKANGKSTDLQEGILNKLSVRCTQFLKTMPDLSDPFQPDEWFRDIFKNFTSDKISLMDLRGFLATLIGDIKGEFDVQRKSQNNAIEWLVSQIQFIDEMFKQDEKPKIPPENTPDNYQRHFKDIQSKLTTIHVKIESLLETKENQGVSLQSSQILKAGDDERPEPSLKRETGGTAEKNKDLLAKIKTLERENRIQTKDAQQAKESLEKRLKELEKDKATIEEECTKMTTRLKELEKEKATIVEECTKMTTRNMTLESEYKYANQKNRQLEDTIRLIRSQKHELELRCSSLASAKISKENPDIADLSDPNRPTKIAEKFSELYDNEWTDGFSSLCKSYGEKNEKQHIESLMALLQDANSFCKASAENIRGLLRDGIRDILLGTEDKARVAKVKSSKPNYLKPGTTATKGRNQDTKSKQKEQAVPTDIVKEVAIDDLIRYNAFLPVKALQQKYLKELKTKPLNRKTEKAEDIIPYINTCVELCWLMAIQSPPVMIDEEVGKYQNEPFVDRFKPYTKKGSTIDYVVWPVLYMAQSGAILCKGVAQCK